MTTSGVLGGSPHIPQHTYDTLKFQTSPDRRVIDYDRALTRELETKRTFRP